jgi:8-oxo-dGTP pyrophosphatase MutT (NUDIX family)
MTLSELSDRLKNSAPPDINGRDEYRQTAVIALLAGEGSDLQLVFEKRSAKIRQGGEICLPGGRLDPQQDSSFVGAAIRETSEEIGIPEDSIAVLGELDTVLAPMGTLVVPFAGYTTVPVESFRPNPDEVEKVFTIPLSFFLDTPPEEYSAELHLFPKVRNPHTGTEDLLFPVEELGLPDRYRESWGGYRSKIYVFRTPEGVIWGLTARIVMDLCRRLGRRR